MYLTEPSLMIWDAKCSTLSLELSAIVARFSPLSPSSTFKSSILASGGKEETCLLMTCLNIAHAALRGMNCETLSRYSAASFTCSRRP